MQTAGQALERPFSPFWKPTIKNNRNPTFNSSQVIHHLKQEKPPL